MHENTITCILAFVALTSAMRNMSLSTTFLPLFSTTAKRAKFPTCQFNCDKSRNRPTMPAYEGLGNGVVGNGVHRADTLAKSVKETPEGKAAKTAVKQHTSWTSNVPVDTQVHGEKTIECSDEEWKVRVDLAAVYRQCYRQGLCEGINNHLTAAIPGTTDRFLVFPFGLLWSEVTASSLLVVDAEGKVVCGTGEPEATAFYIHARLHMKHPKGAVVMHTHQSWTAAICALEDPSLLMIHQNCLRFYQDVAHDSYNGLVLDNSEGDHLAEVMQQKRVLLHQNHGVIICAESVAVCFDMLYYLERAAKIQVRAMSTGKKLNIVSDKVCAQFKECFMDSGVSAEYARLHLEALKRDMLASEADKNFIT